MNSVKEYNALS